MSNVKTEVKEATKSAAKTDDMATSDDNTRDQAPHLCKERNETRKLPKPSRPHMH